MDLYRILRQSLYLLVGAGAFAMALAENNAAYLLVAAGAGILAGILLDSGKIKPAPKELAFALALALLVYFAQPLQHERAWNREIPVACGRFLFSLNLVLLLTSFADWVLILAGTSTLAIVVLSGAIDPSPSLFLRIACFVALTAWMLFVHSLWRTRQRYAAQQRLNLGRANVLPGAAADSVPRRALAQGVGLTVALSLACLTLGLFLFFSAPRIERVGFWLEGFISSNKPQPASDGGTLPGRAELDVPHTLADSVDLNALGPVNENYAPALTVTFTPFAKSLIDDGRIYLRGLAFSDVNRGTWKKPALNSNALEAGDDKLLAITDPSSPDAPRGDALIHQSVESIHLTNPYYFAVYPVARLRAARVALDPEGGLHFPIVQAPQPYELWSCAPAHAAGLPAGAKAGHPDLARYVRDSGIAPQNLDDVRALAREITENARSDAEKAQRIAAYLKNSGRYSYTLELDKLLRGRDPIRDFLLGASAEQRRGHCGYFATAFVALCRLSGLPARMATGFTTKAPDVAAGEPATIVFRNSAAHAWGEVYFKAIGWVIFDPTPPAPPPAPRPPPVQVAETTPAQATEPPSGGALERAWATVIGYDSRQQRDVFKRMRSLLRGGLGGSERVLTGRSAGGWILAVVVWIATGISLLWLVSLFLRRGRRRRGRATVGTLRTRAAVAFYNDLLQVLSKRGYVRRPGQTPREFAEHVLRAGGPAYQSVLTITNIFEGVRYGGAEISQDDFNALQNALDGLRELTFAAGT